MLTKKMKNTFLLLAILIGAVACNTPKTNSTIEIELNGNWQLVQVNTGNSYAANVPGCIHTDLLENKVIDDPYFRTNEKKQQWIDKEDWFYVVDFEINAEVLSREFVELDFKGLDTYADVYLNDSLLFKADNMFREWQMECKSLLKEGTNKLKVYFHSPIKKGLEKLETSDYGYPAGNDQSENGGLGDKKVSVFTRKAPYHYGWDWGPRFVTSGIWRPVFIKAWSNSKINNVQIIQNELNEKEAKITEIISIQSSVKKEVTIKVTIEVKHEDTILFSDKISLEEGDNKVTINYIIKNPKLWWTKGLGEQNLYNIETNILSDGKLLTKTNTIIGLRTLKLVQKPDKSGSSFFFELNGVPVFMKGANHIPNDIFLPRVTPEIYEREIKMAAESNMNMLRVWGGGVYEGDVFYELCDKYGILVWQDFMFACSMYPGDEAFLENIKQEAIDNVVRLRNHPSIALWCGNNEIDVAWQEHNEKGGWGWKQKYNDEQHAEIWKAYEDIFLKTLPEVIAKYDTKRDYWHSSPMASPTEHASYSTQSGDMHYWGVWHGKAPFSDFVKTRSRFMSEYGFQSFPEFNTVKKYALAEDFDIESEVMAAHQRSGIGNLRIKEYMSWYYKTPTDFEKFLYVGQLLQAEAMKIAIEAHRRDMPYNMGTLYWQINDCWPVASWSSSDYYGRWKASQYFIKNAFEPILVSPILDSKGLHVFVISDKLENVNSKLKIEIMDFDGNVLFEKLSDIQILANTSKIYLNIDRKELSKFLNNKQVVLNTSIYNEEKLISSNYLYFTEIKELNLPKAEIKYTITKEDGAFRIELKSDKLAKNVYLTSINEEGFFSNNYFDLLPGKTIIINYLPENKNFDLNANLNIISLVDSY